MLLAPFGMLQADATKPNVLLIILDDQNAFAGRTDLQQWLPKHDEPRNPDSPTGKGGDD